MPRGFFLRAMYSSSDDEEYDFDDDGVRPQRLVQEARQARREAEQQAKLTARAMVPIENELAVAVVSAVCEETVKKVAQDELRSHTALMDVVNVLCHDVVKQECIVEAVYKGTRQKLMWEIIEDLESSVVLEELEVSILEAQEEDKYSLQELYINNIIKDGVSEDVWREVVEEVVKAAHDRLAEDLGKPVQLP